MRMNPFTAYTMVYNTALTFSQWLALLCCYALDLRQDQTCRLLRLSAKMVGRAFGRIRDACAWQHVQYGLSLPQAQAEIEWDASSHLKRKTATGVCHAGRVLVCSDRTSGAKAAFPLNDVVVAKGGRPPPERKTEIVAHLSRLNGPTSLHISDRAQDELILFDSI